ncbi:MULTISPECIES: O-antigen ligase family protein [Thalassospira]|uniref:O-antigen ligase family protein n=1 Tax=Thalassospira aquimaris TaxID=3037796 RepID=A0ABT6G673_9PROT|nr:MULTISPECIES: O-antigen ligase family protein [Thalassospira]MDG4717407.1 O-antigen ligase family protein [Thalassospira sp. FZY0004]
MQSGQNFEKLFSQIINKLPQSDQINSYKIGILTSFLLVIPFCKINANGLDISLSGKSQLILINVTIISLIIATKLKIKDITIPSLIPLIMISLIYFSTSINSDLFAKSTERALITLIPSFLILILIQKIRNIDIFYVGIIKSLSYICAFSVLYAIIGIIYSNNYISTRSYEIIDIQIFGLKLEQIIANRAFYYGNDKFYIQRHAGILPNPNGLGLLCAIIFGFSYNKLLSRRMRNFIRIVSIAGLIISFSRMGILLFAVTTVYINIKSSNIRQIFTAFCFVIVISFSLAVSSFSATQSHQATFLPTILNHEVFSLGERSQLLAAAWNGFINNWLIGVGFGVGSDYLFPDASNIKAVHSVFMNSLVETGIFGTFLLTTIWISPIFISNRSKLRSDNQSNFSHITAGVLLGLFVAEAFDLSVTRFHYIHLIFVALLGIWLSLRQNANVSETEDAHSSQTP